MTFTANDEHFMKEALAFARIAFSEQEVPIGSVVVRDGRMIGRGRKRPTRPHRLRLRRPESRLLRNARQHPAGPPPEPPLRNRGRPPRRRGRHPDATLLPSPTPGQGARPGTKVRCRPHPRGEVLEWLIRPVSKTGKPERASGVRIPPSPPISPLR